MCASTRSASCPEDKGRVVVGFLESFFQRYVEYDFTASLEEQLDRVSNNEIDWKQLLRDFWGDFIAAVDEIKELRITQVLDALNDLLGPHIFPKRADGGDPRQCPTCGNGQLSLKVGRFGAFVGCSNYPECRFTRQIDAGRQRRRQRHQGARRGSGHRPRRDVRGGRFGPYVQLGEGKRRKTKREAEARRHAERHGARRHRSGEGARRCCRCRAMSASIPRDGELIIAGIGRFGPYVKHGKTYANLEQGDEVLTIGLNRAVTLIAEKKANPGKGRRFGADPGKLARRPSRQGRADRRQEWPLRRLCQP